MTTRAHNRIVALVLCGCAVDESMMPQSDDTGASAGSKGDNPLSTTSDAGEESSGASADDDGQGESTTTAPTSDESSSDESSTGASACEKTVVVMGYWPPTNEMLRPWSRNPAQNPEGWVGEDWHGHGYDVQAFFPEFPPDGDPTNDEVGEDGAVGSPDFDLRVDYQATSADFWRIVDEHRPVIVVTTSRGGAIGWEIEALEGGHGVDNPGDPSQDWLSDGHDPVRFPTQETVDPRSWDAISTHRQGATLPTQLPVQAIVDATTALAVTDVVVDDGTSGTFLSGFLALHGLYYQLHTPRAVAAGHIHVGIDLPVADASVLVEASLDAILTEHPADTIACP